LLKSATGWPRARAAFVQLLSDLRADPSTIIVSAAPDLLAKACHLYGERPDKEWSLTDCSSIMVMQEQGLTDALTTDHHFEQAGFRALLREGGEP
jgi:predicted nucleic acid-binding protein